MAKPTEEDVKAELAALEQRLRAGEELTNHDFELSLKSAGSSHKGAEKLIKKHGSAYLLREYAKSFGNHVPSGLKKYL